MSLHRFSIVRPLLVLLIGYLLATVTGSALASENSHSALNPVTATARAAERLFPSGTRNVVLSSAADNDSIALAQALATKLSGALLLTESPHALGTATAHALRTLTIPKVTTSDTVLPFQAAAGKPHVYIVGDNKLIDTAVAEHLRSRGYQVTRLSGHGPALVRDVMQRVAPPMPSAATTAGFPDRWTVYAGNPSHNSAYRVPASAPDWEKEGVSWRFAQDAAVPLHAPFPELKIRGPRRAPVAMTQNLGEAVGVTAVNGVIYAESDDSHLYALDAKSGALLWKTSALANTLMANPIVANNLVYVAAGDTGFPFSQVLKYARSQGHAPLTRGLQYSAVYAFNATTGRLVWRHDFRGEAMPTPVYYRHTVYEATGGGRLWALDAATGKVKWKTPLHGFDSMSSANIYVNPKTHVAEILVGTTDKNHVIAVNAANGTVLWTQKTPLKIFNTGMGDNSPTVDQDRGVVVQDSVVDFNRKAHTTNLAIYAMDAQHGKILWTRKLGVGHVPPAYKAGLALIHAGIVYVGSPVTSTIYALNETNGEILWRFHIQHAGPAGAGRGNPVYAYGVLWLAAGPKLYALDPKTGRELGDYKPGGRFGIVNPVIVGGTMYLDNSYDWVQAVALKKIYPSLQIMSNNAVRAQSH